MIKFTNNDFKYVEQNQPSQMPIGTTFIGVYNKESHIILKTYSGYVSLNNPELTWPSKQAFDDHVVRYINIEVKIID